MQSMIKVIGASRLLLLTLQFVMFSNQTYSKLLSTGWNGVNGHWLSTTVATPTHSIQRNSEQDQIIIDDSSLVMLQQFILFIRSARNVAETNMAYGLQPTTSAE